MNIEHYSNKKNS